MKKFITVLLSALMFVSAVIPAFATEDDFTPITGLGHWPCWGEFYDDSECTHEITTAEMEIGKTYYYQMHSGVDGVYIKSIPQFADVMDEDSFVYDGKYEDKMHIIPHYVYAGDITGYDESVNIEDAIAIARYCAHYYGSDDEHLDLEAADFDRDGNVNVLDAIKLTQVIVGGENPYPKGVLKGFDIIGEVEYELGEEVATVFEYDNAGILIDSVEEFRAYWDAADTNLTSVHNIPTDVLQGLIDEVKSEYPLDTDALYAKYDEKFFEENVIVIAKVSDGYSNFESFESVNGELTVTYNHHVSGVPLVPEFTLNQIIIVPCDEIPADSEITVTNYSYGLC